MPFCDHTQVRKHRREKLLVGPCVRKTGDREWLASVSLRKMGQR